MQYLGKIIGVAVALMMGGGFWGVVLGFLIGHMFDRARSRRLNVFANQQERQSLFFSTTFEVMGHLTKSKGRVTEADIHVANLLMDRMNLHGDARTAAEGATGTGGREAEGEVMAGEKERSEAGRLHAVMRATGHSAMVPPDSRPGGGIIASCMCFTDCCAGIFSSRGVFWNCPGAKP